MPVPAWLGWIPVPVLRWLDRVTTPVLRPSRNAARGWALASVIANAVANALQSFNPDLRELPLSPPRIWAMVQNGRS